MDELLHKIHNKQNKARSFIVKYEPRNKTLINISIICGIAGTALAGIPAIGGSAAIDGIKSVTQPHLPVWQILCIGAALATLAATVATAFRSNHDMGNKLAKAQVCAAKLEMLELLLLNNQIDMKQAIEKYGEYSAEVAFIP